jgi:hypothetical protein
VGHTGLLREMIPQTPLSSVQNGRRKLGRYWSNYTLKPNRLAFGRVAQLSMICDAASRPAGEPDFRLARICDRRLYCRMSSRRQPSHAPILRPAQCRNGAPLLSSSALDPDPGGTVARSYFVRSLGFILCTCVVMIFSSYR